MCNRISHVPIEIGDPSRRRYEHVEPMCYTAATV